jgi:hypothetical protein
MLTFLLGTTHTARITPPPPPLGNHTRASAKPPPSHKSLKPRRTGAKCRPKCISTPNQAHARAAFPAYSAHVLRISRIPARVTARIWQQGADWDKLRGNGTWDTDTELRGNELVGWPYKRVADKGLLQHDLLSAKPTLYSGGGGGGFDARSGRRGQGGKQTVLTRLMLGRLGSQARTPRGAGALCGRNQGGGLPAGPHSRLVSAFLAAHAPCARPCPSHASCSVVCVLLCT